MRRSQTEFGNECNGVRIGRRPRAAILRRRTMRRCSRGEIHWSELMMRRLFSVLLVSTIAAFPDVRSLAADVDFARDVQPILRRACWECHSAGKREGGLALDQREAAFKGGDSGAAIVPGKAAESELIRRVKLPKSDSEVMPARGETLKKSEVATLEKWINAGAEWPAESKAASHWAYMRPQRPELPRVAQLEEAKTPIDRFVIARLEQEGLKLSPTADHATLVRRVFFDLVGLPPSPSELQAFVDEVRATGTESESQKFEAAFERLVDRLLASNQFGVKWARQWLDAARYSDSHGFQRDDLRDVWAFRDWVVNALNADMPFDQFTIEQLAGDLLPNPTEQQLIATGFNRNAPTNVEAGSDPEETRVNQVFDRVNTLGMVWLGTSLECCQCHDHKYDPFTMRDYYGLFAIMNNTELEADRSNPKVPGSIRFLGPEMPLKGAAEVESIDDENKKPKKATTLVMRELAMPRSSFVFQRGDFRNAGASVSPATPAALHPVVKSTEEARLTRLDLARWLVAKENPLTPRVVVNRWWGEIFGQGLVSTPEDFGIKGEAPSHPELLDWLAVEYVDGGWSLKKLLRQIVLSNVYRQSSRLTAELRETDDRNVLLARGPRFRMDAEMIRDNLLAVSGLLSLAQGGPSIRPQQPDGLWVKVGGQRYNYAVSAGEAAYRRGLYVVWKRGAPYPSFINFDANNRLACRVRRPRTNTPLQALTLLNDPVYVEAAISFARRIITEQPDANTDERIAHACRIALQREVRPFEGSTLRQLFNAQLAESEKSPQGAKALLGKSTLPEGVSAPEFAAWYAVATALLNLDETITKP